MNIEKTFTEWWKKHSKSYGAVFFDIDGTIISGNRALPGASRLLEDLRISQFPASTGNCPEKRKYSFCK